MTHDINPDRHDTVLKALADVQRFYEKDTVTFSELWKRYNVCAKHDDDLRCLESSELKPVLADMAEIGAIETSIFGITDVDDYECPL